MIRPSIRTTALGLAAALVAGTVALAGPALAATDATAPALAGTVSFSPATVDTTSGDAATTVAVRLTDDVSGVTDATLTLTAPGGAFDTSVELDQTSGTATDGTWSGVQTFSAQFDPTGTWTAAKLTATDGAGRTAEITSGLGAGVTVTRTTDTVAPSLRGATTDVTDVDTSADPVDAVVRVSATDDLSGVESGVVTFTSPDGDATAEGSWSGSDPAQGSRSDGSWDVPVTFPARSAPGVWRLTGINLGDGQSNARFYDEDDAELPSLAIRVTTADDTTSPVLTSVAVGPAKRSTAYGRSGYVYAQVGFTDDVSGVASALVTLQRPSGVNDDSENYPVSVPDTELKTGTTRNGTVTVPIYVEGFATGTWKIAAVELVDAAGNVATVSTAQLPAGRTTFEVTATAADTAAPTTSGHAFSPTTLDTRTGGQSGSVLVSATDPDAVPSGVASGTVTLSSPSGDENVTATFDGDNDLVAGDPSNGTFRASFWLPANSEDGAWRVTSVQLTDGAKRSSTTTSFSSPPDLTVLGRGRAPATAPAAPTIGAASITGTTATVRWTPPTSNGGARITGYVVTAYRGGTAAGTVDTSGATTTSTAVPGLVRGATYTFFVKARNAAGLSDASAPSTAVTVPAAPAAAPGIGAATLSDTTATVSWTAPTDNGGAAITGYVVTPYIGDAKQAVTRVANTTSATVADLARGRTYTFRVAATTSAGDGTQSQPSNSVSVAATVPAAPRVASTRVLGTSATVAWEAPYDGGAAITGYTVVGSPAGSCTTTGTSCVVTGLTPDQSYSFTVSATNRVGLGTDSAPSPTVVAARPSATSLAVVGAPAKILYGTSTTVAGLLTVAGSNAAAPGQLVRLQYRYGTGSWATSAAAGTTGADGVVRFGGFRPARTVQVRLVSDSSAGYVTSTSAARTIAVGRTLTLGSKTSRVKRGKTLLLTGRATPVRPGGTVTLQRWSGGKWRSVASKRVSGSTFAFTVRASKRGSTAYRVVTTADTQFAASFSKARTVRVR